MHTQPRMNCSPIIQMKKNCRLCSAHGVSISAVSHICPNADCICNKCKLIRKRRAIVAEQTRIRRTQKKVLHPCVSPSSSSSSSDSPHITNRAYHCQRCQNHGVTIPKKNHYGKCAYSLCRCPKCELWTNRSHVDEQLRRSEEPCNSTTFPMTLPPTSSAGVSDLSVSSTSTISALLSSSSIPSLPNNPIVAHQLIIDDTIPIVDASILPIGYLEACIATSQVEYITPTPVILSNFPYQ